MIIKKQKLGRVYFVSFSKIFVDFDLLPKLTYLMKEGIARVCVCVCTGICMHVYVSMYCAHMYIACLQVVEQNIAYSMLKLYARII
jgi:hypothetical protein